MEHELIFEKSITRWDEAVPLGNGRIGALIWGEPEELRFSLDRTDIWDRSQPLNTMRPDFTYAQLVKLAREKKTKEIRELFDAPYQHPTPTKLPAGKLIFSFPQGRNIRSVLSLQEARAFLTAETAEGEICLESFCHAVTKTGMIRVKVSESAFAFRLEHPDFSELLPGKEAKGGQDSYDPDQRGISQGSLKKLYYPAPSFGRQEGNPSFVWFSQKVDESFTFGIVVGSRRMEGETWIFYRIVHSKEGEDWLMKAVRQLEEELAAGYEFMAESHLLWWESYWSKSSLSLGDKEVEKNWYLANYLFASCSRKGEYPMPLQGVWTADDGNLPPWKGDYHNDLNTQLCYSHFYKANHLEEGEAFLDFLWNSREAGRSFAKSFYQTEGVCLPGVMSIDGKPLGGWPMYSLSPTHQIWLCQTFDLYYRYTEDKRFLEEKAWVYFRETAECLTSLLEERGGQLYLPVSSSPEIHDDEEESWLTPNSNYDLALMMYLYRTLAEYSRLLGKKEEEYWERLYHKLPGLAVSEEKILMLSPDERLKESHRHLSNAMAICPLKLLTEEKDREIIDATVLDYECWGSGMWVGFSFVWMSHLYAIQKNGEGAFTQLRIFWESFCSPNGFHLNGDYRKRGYSTFHYRPFTLEANMYAADALQEMLLQRNENRIEILPAIPESWMKEKLSFSGFRLEGGLLVSAQWIPQEGCRVEIVNAAGGMTSEKRTNGEGANDEELELIVAGKYIKRFLLPPGQEREDIVMLQD
ncbi:MAG: glycoside hydrolase N-terminal domain-containing protein [Lachnospiraceae bacterium]|nr:glycoside hydrolase N-terminal domain-containing protein [Lachnospiraceae bacterium]